MKKFILPFFALIGLSILTACSHFTSTNFWNYQKITVSTQPQGARCMLHNNRGNWRIKSTPATFTIHRSKTALRVFCYKHGYSGITKLIKSTAPIMRKGMLVPDYHPANADYNYHYPQIITLRLPSRAKSKNAKRSTCKKCSRTGK